MKYLLLAMLLACGAKADEAKKKAAATEQAAKVKAGLKHGDLADGFEDKTVTLCAGCELGMDGEPDHTIEKDGYELYMCSGNCKLNYEKNLDKNLAELAK